mmetsp:Transcript_14394/g.30991  ORF Transcript_14394/g.30991 Transcript_14394/m.30991 type:complete len:286 (+) Transcript_14394:86-943(+)
MAALGTSLAELRAYVTQESLGQRPAAGVVMLSVKHSNFKSTQFPELRFWVSDTIAEVKQRLYSTTGTLASHMQLSLFGPDGSTLIANVPSNADQMTLGSFSPPQRGVIFVQDTDPFSKSKNGWLENTTLVEKYTISDEAYSKRDGTYRKFKEERLQEDPTWTLKREMAERRGAVKTESSESAQGDGSVSVQIGDRCQVFPGDRRGTVRFVGHVAELPGGGVWVGVEYSEPVGKNDGTIDGRRVFACKGAKFGGFVRPANVSLAQGRNVEDDDLDELLSNSSEDEI